MDCAKLLEEMLLAWYPLIESVSITPGTPVMININHSYPPSGAEFIIEDFLKRRITKGTAWTVIFEVVKPERSRARS